MYRKSSPVALGLLPPPIDKTKYKKDNLRADGRLIHPANYVIVGPSQAGKSTWLRRVISEKNKLFRHKEKFSEPNIPKMVIYSYGIYSDEVNALLKSGLIDKVIRGLPRTFEDLEKIIRPYSEVGVILIVDDAVSHFMSANKSSYLPQMFETLSHHLNLAMDPVSGHPNIDHYQRYSTNIFMKEFDPYTIYVRDGVELK